MATNDPQGKKVTRPAGVTPADSVRGAWRQLGRFFAKNPTLILTLLYALITGVGILSSWSLYAEFGISIFDYAEIGDFLLAAFKSPGAFYNLLFVSLNVLFGLLMYALLPLWLPWTLRNVLRISSERPFRQLYFLYSLLLPILPFLLATLYFTTVTQERSIAVAHEIKCGVHPMLKVQYRAYSSSAGQVTKSGLELIGSTQRFVFFYDVDRKRTLVIPQAQIVSIEVPEQD